MKISKYSISSFVSGVYFAGRPIYGRKSSFHNKAPRIMNFKYKGVDNSLLNQYLFTTLILDLSCTALPYFSPSSWI